MIDQNRQRIPNARLFVIMAQVTNGIKISVRVKFKEEYSEPDKRYFVFFYRITIENYSDFEVQLLRRHWDIFDSNGIKTIVEGDGVVGEKPILAPGELFSYESACNLESGMGRMSGYYELMRTENGELFRADIPDFILEVPYMLN
ncbi:MAG: Co2+/Mg2+ efflux protein ApaG [Flavobacteriales bacterium]|nr:Co2+/Mg2+ efflux protein ApaG [Flavobacteriales bacterium]